MLKELCIENFALIDIVKINFVNGFNIFTGETGSGKSIIIDALSFVLGKRADKNYIRKNKHKATIEAVFYTNSDNQNLINNLLINEDIDFNDSILILRRELFEDGKSTCRVNGKLVTINFLKQISSLLITIHSQNEFSEILTKESQLNILDDFINLKDSETYILYLADYTLYNKKQKELEDIKGKYDKTAILRELDLLDYQINEIEQAKLSKNEYASLEERITILENSEDISNLINNVYDEIYSNNNNILKQIDNYRNKFNKFKSMDTLLDDWSNEIEDIYFKLDEFALSVRDNLDKFSFDEFLLVELKDRYSEVNKVLSKYGNDIDSVFNYLEEISIRKVFLTDFDVNRMNLEQEIDKLSKQLNIYSKILSQSRRSGAIKLQYAMLSELFSLEMNNSKFEILIEDLTEFTSNGLNSITFYISFNKGEEVKPFNKIASGGEISRFMLALKKVSATFDKIPTMVFDEIDTGISGKAAKIVGSKLKEIASERQVICITHLPQIAAKGDYHYSVSKKDLLADTQTTIVLLKGNARVSELAKMISGDESSSNSLRYAKELLELK